MTPTLSLLRPVTVSITNGHQSSVHRQSENTIFSIVESITSSQISKASKSTKPSSDDTLASVIQRLDTLQTSNEQLKELNDKFVQKSAGWVSSIAILNSTVDKLEKELVKERDDRKAERDRLEERLEEQDRSYTARLEEQDRSYTARLAEEREARKRDMQSISEVRALSKNIVLATDSLFLA